MEELQELIKFLKAKGFTNTKIDVDLLCGIIEYFGSKQETKQLILSGVINCPDELYEPVLAKIEHINSFGKGKWYEVVYYDGNWRSYSGSKTFEDGEKVVKWKYCKGCL